MSRRRLLIDDSDREPSVLASWKHVLWSIENDRYANDYRIGDLIPLDLGTMGQVNAQIADFDHDDRADGHGKAHITFITKEICIGGSNMNSTNTNSGGWGSTSMRSITMSLIWSKLPNILHNSILEVTKKSSAGNQSTIIVSSNDKLWIPSIFEVDMSKASPIFASEGTPYLIFTDDTSRVKALSGVNRDWWLRSPAVNNTTSFFVVNSDGSVTSSYNASKASGVVFGFCV